MRRETSVYLDLLRFTAAFVVVLGHFGTQLVSAGILWQMRRYGEPAVLLFFVISGYVVSFVLWSRHPSGASYFVNRASRLYSVVVPGLLLIFLLDYVGMKDNPDFYNRVPRFDASLESYLASAVFAESGLGYRRTAGVGRALLVAGI